MTEELDRLRAALKSAPPAPDPAAKAQALARAMEKFDEQAAKGQEPDAPARPMSDRPKGAGFLTGVRRMFVNLTSRPTLAATASVAALCAGLIVVIPALRDRPAPVATAPAQADRPAATATLESAASGTMPTQAAETEMQPAAKSAAGIAAQTPPTRRDAGVTTMAEPLADAPADALAGAMPVSPTPAPAPDMAYGRTAGMTAGLTAPNPIPPTYESEADFAWQQAGTEAFANAGPNPLKVVAEEPVSTFSIDADSASYSVVRSSLSAGALPPAEAVRIEEMVNYFPYAYPAPTVGEAPFRPTVSVFPTPWNSDTRLVRIGIQGRLPDLADRPPLNLVFLIDTSGSMDDPAKLPLLVQSFRLMVSQLRPEDRVAIVTYAGSAGEVLEPTPAKDRAKVLAALDRLMAGGSTAGQDGLIQAYAVAEAMKTDNDTAVTRVILATDGDFNVGLSDPEALKDFIAGKRETGTYLSVLGFGRGNLDDATMQALAQNGNGTAAYIDTLSEAQKVLADQLTGALFPIADDVKIQVEFNPAVVAEYRLIGYETRALAREDFANDRVDAGEIGAGHQVTALYEVTPVGSPAIRNAPLRYGTGAPDIAQAGTTELGFLKMRWKEPGAKASQLLETPILPAAGEADADARFAAAIAGMGQLLTGATYLGDWGWTDAIALASGARGDDPFGYRAEAVQLMQLAESLDH